jgi:hypothetical protein
MFVDFRRPGSWSDLTERAAEALDVILLKNQLRFYQNTVHALIEVTQGLARQLPLKKKIFYFRDMSAAFEPALTLLAKEGYQLTALDLSELQNPEAHLAQMDRETLITLYAADDPVLGIIYPTEKWDAALKAASVPRLRLSHFSDLLRPFVSVADRTEIRMGTTPAGGAYALMGERLRTGSVVAPFLGWNNFVLPDTDLQLMRSGRALRDGLVAQVKEFESAVSAFGRIPEFKMGMRVYDRALFIFPDVDGHALIDRWSRRLGISLHEAGEENTLETTSLSRWGGVKTFEFLKAYGLSAQDLRGLVLVSGQLFSSIGSSELKKTLVEVRQSILLEQNGSE